MNEAPETNNQATSAANGLNQRRTKKTAIVAVVGVIAVAAIALLLWLFIPRGSGGRPVPAPRSVGPDQTATQAGKTSGEFTLTRSKRWASVFRVSQTASKQPASSSPTLIVKLP
jgi:hypothetical protein